MNDKNILIIGCGRHAKGNIYPSVLLNGGSIKAISARHPASARSCADTFAKDAAVYDDYKKMLDKEDTDKVIIVLPADSAVPVTLDCLRLGKMVFVEKPLGMSLEQAGQIAEAAEAANSRLMVGFMKRFAPVYLKIKEAIVSSTYGAPCSFHAFFGVDASQFCKNDRDFFYFVAIHYIDLLYSLFGEPSNLSAYKNTVGNGMSYSLNFQFKNGVVGTLSLENRSAWTREAENLEVTFEDGFAATDNTETVSFHESSCADGKAWSNLQECTKTYTCTCNPASGIEKDLYLRGFCGEISAFLENSFADDCQENYAVTKICEDILGQLLI